MNKTETHVHKRLISLCNVREKREERGKKRGTRRAMKKKKRLCICNMHFIVISVPEGHAYASPPSSNDWTKSMITGTLSETLRSAVGGRTPSCRMSDRNSSSYFLASTLKSTPICA
jgi:hypothetical protein